MIGTLLFLSGVAGLVAVAGVTIPEIIQACRWQRYGRAFCLAVVGAHAMNGCLYVLASNPQ